MHKHWNTCSHIYLFFSLWKKIASKTVTKVCVNFDMNMLSSPPCFYFRRRQFLLCLIVWCGVFGRKEIVGALKIVSVLCLISSYSFFRTLLDWFSVETIPFLQLWIYLIYVTFVFDMYTPVYSLCTWVSLFWYQ